MIKYKISKVLMILSGTIGTIATFLTMLLSPFFGETFLYVVVAIQILCATIFYISMHFYFKYK